MILATIWHTGTRYAIDYAINIADYVKRRKT